VIERVGLVYAIYDPVVEVCMRQEEVCDGQVTEAPAVEGIEAYGIVPKGVERAWAKLRWGVGREGS
jgi:hypothetical protein